LTRVDDSEEVRKRLKLWGGHRRRYIVTNDRYWDYIEKAGTGPARKATLQWIRTHCVSFTFAADDFLPNPDFRFQPAAG
jgi:hypothetical protein